MFVQQLWRKRLAKVGLSAKGLKKQNIYIDLEEFAKKKLDPLMVAEFVNPGYYQIKLLLSGFSANSILIKWTIKCSIMLCI